MFNQVNVRGTNKANFAGRNISISPTTSGAPVHPTSINLQRLPAASLDPAARALFSSQPAWSSRSNANPGVSEARSERRFTTECGREPALNR